jgi:hypothetical protein
MRPLLSSLALFVVFALAGCGRAPKMASAPPDAPPPVPKLDSAPAQAAPAAPVAAAPEVGDTAGTTSGGAGNGPNLPQIPFGQTYKDFQFPVYQNGQLSYRLSAVSAKGITVNRADTNDLKIEIFTQGKVTTTITSPDADLYVAERKMRTNHTVKVDRADMTATSQSCDFDLTTKKYLMRQNVKVVLKNFDVGSSTKKPSSSSSSSSAPSSPLAFPASLGAAPASAGETSPDAVAPVPRNGDSLLDTPGAYGTTNSGPVTPPAGP